MELELLDITIDIELENFKSSNPSLDVYLKTQAYFEHIMHLCNTKLVKLNNDIVAFFTMEFRNLKIPIDYDDNIYPVVCLKCLAVDDKLQGNGIGTAILQYVASSVAGSFARTPGGCEHFVNIISGVQQEWNIRREEKRKKVNYKQKIIKKIKTKNLAVASEFEAPAKNSYYTVLFLLGLIPLILSKMKKEVLNKK